jgi:hypothetical protein
MAERARTRPVRIAAMLALACASAGCGGRLQPEPHADQVSGQAADAAGVASAMLTYDHDIAPLTQACAGCHPSLNPFNPTTYQGILMKVTPGNPDASVVVTKIEAGHNGIPQSTAQALRAWVAGGAKEN